MTMTLLYYDPVYMQHRTGRHPESAERLQTVVRHLHFVGLDSLCDRPGWEPASRLQVERVHTAEYLNQLSQTQDAGGGWLDEDTVMSDQSLVAALKASGAVCDAVDRVIAGDANTAMCLSRPPGHHALADRAMGFCLINHVAVAARQATARHQMNRVMIVDFDVHHGNGTQDLFYDDEQIAFFSMHRSPFYPHTGREDETGTGPALGTTCNAPVMFGTPRQTQMETFAAKLQDFASRHPPELIIVSAGFDSHRNDPVGSLGWETDDYQTIAETILDLAHTHCEGKVISVLEGGYDPTALSDSVTLYLETFMDDEHRRGT
ncbi:histone deacetylase [Crateriforma spongiae]|uniref:histone deacetylase family protein n=1 Tax=Crateriforma spongiae TaxID=2724528 RepID=UPI0039AFE6A0